MPLGYEALSPSPQPDNPFLSGRGTLQCGLNRKTQVLYSYKNLLSEPPQAGKIFLLSMRRLPGTGDLRAEDSPQELRDTLESLPDPTLFASHFQDRKYSEPPELLPISLLLPGDIPTRGKFSTHIPLPLDLDKSFCTSQGPGPCLEPPVLALSTFYYYR